MIEVRRYASIDSTNEEARRLAASGERGPLWIVAEEQTKGRRNADRSDSPACLANKQGPCAVHEKGAVCGDRGEAAR